MASGAHNTLPVVQKQALVVVSSTDYGRSNIGYHRPANAVSRHTNAIPLTEPATCGNLHVPAVGVEGFTTS